MDSMVTIVTMDTVVAIATTATTEIKNTPYELQEIKYLAIIQNISY